jgi:hypothetical protein
MVLPLLPVFSDVLLLKSLGHRLVGHVPYRLLPRLFGSGHFFIMLHITISQF